MMVYLENPRNLPKSKEKLWELINELSKAMDTQYVKKKKRNSDSSNEYVKILK